MFAPYVCNRCHDLLMRAINEDGDYHCIITGISKWSEAIKLLQNIDFTEKKGAL